MMMKYKYFYFLFLISYSASAQIGINTEKPITVFHIDGAGDNDSGYPNANQVVNDFVVTKDGNVGIGTITPQNKIEINSGITDESGLRFTQFNSNTHQSDSHLLLGVSSSGDVVSHTSNYIIGDIKHSMIATDHDGWYLLDGRNISTLPTSAQSAATSLGLTDSLPDARDRVLKMKKDSAENILDIGGTNKLLITRDNLPKINISIEVSGKTTIDGKHEHGLNYGKYYLLGFTTVNNPGNWNFRGNQFDPVDKGSWGGIGVFLTTGDAGIHTHTIDGNYTVPSGGENIEIENTQASISVETFIYLGP